MAESLLSSRNPPTTPDVRPRLRGRRTKQEPQSQMNLHNKRNPSLFSWSSGSDSLSSDVIIKFSVCGVTAHGNTSKVWLTSVQSKLNNQFYGFVGLTISTVSVATLTRYEYKVFRHILIHIFISRTEEVKLGNTNQSMHISLG
jgi:hypothetical protein